MLVAHVFEGLTFASLVATCWLGVSVKRQFSAGREPSRYTLMALAVWLVLAVLFFSAWIGAE